MATDFDWELRLAAFGGLEQLKKARGGIVTDQDLEAGFEFRGEVIKFWTASEGSGDRSS